MWKETNMYIVFWDLSVFFLLTKELIYFLSLLSVVIKKNVSRIIDKFLNFSCDLNFWSLEGSIIGPLF